MADAEIIEATTNATLASLQPSLQRDKSIDGQMSTVALTCEVASKWTGLGAGI